jgi:hypothetical protein
MMNSMDKDKIIESLVNDLRVRTSWHRVELKSDDLEDAGNFLDTLLSKYIDDRHINDGRQ